MSRTIRRKNAWNERHHVDDFINWSWFQQRIRHVKYHGLNDDQVISRRKAEFHRETPRNWSGHHWLKEYSSWKLRALNKHELIKAMKTEEGEENLQLTTCREVAGLWRWYDD